jgi:Na+-transporting methylmalonyl-CoA/oxaloacetate decarboxylase gamma subunit
MHTEGHDMGRDAADSSTPGDQLNPNNPGYETTDVHVTGVAVFLAGLFGTVIIFFFFCYGMGKVINNMWEKQDGPASKWKVEAGAVPPGGKRRDLTSNAQMQQEQLQRMTTAFPQPRLDIDDGNQATADLHAREDLMLEYYSTVDGQPGTIRIPIERAMELIAQRGLPVANQTATPAQTVAEAGKPEVQLPLTTGFARTGFELTVMEARQQKMNYGKAEAATHAELTQPK